MYELKKIWKGIYGQQNVKTVLHVSTVNGHHQANKEHSV